MSTESSIEALHSLNQNYKSWKHVKRFFYSSVTQSKKQKKELKLIIFTTLEESNKIKLVLTLSGCFIIAEMQMLCSVLYFSLLSVE